MCSETSVPQSNDIIWRAVKCAQIPAVMEPLGLMHDGKRPDGATLMLWARGKALAWDVTVPDTYADSHIHDTAIQSGAAAYQVNTNICTIEITHIIFFHLQRYRRFMEWKHQRIHIRNRKTRQHHHFRLMRDSFPVSTSVSGLTKGEVVSLGTFPSEWMTIKTHILTW